MKIEVNVTEQDVLSARSWIKEYQAKVVEFEAKAEACHSNQRGGYLSQASQRKKDVKRWQATLDARMEWLRENNLPLWVKLDGDVFRQPE